MHWTGLKWQLSRLGHTLSYDERTIGPHWCDSQSEVRPAPGEETLTVWLPGSLLPPTSSMALTALPSGPFHLANYLGSQRVPGALHGRGPAIIIEGMVETMTLGREGAAGLCQPWLQSGGRKRCLPCVSLSILHKERGPSWMQN